MAAAMAKNNPQRSRSLNICKPLFKARLAMVIALGGHGGAVQTTRYRHTSARPPEPMRALNYMSRRNRMQREKSEPIVEKN
jgi:hypothetical protein